MGKPTERVHWEGTQTAREAQNVQKRAEDGTMEAGVKQQMVHTVNSKNEK